MHIFERKKKKRKKKEEIKKHTLVNNLLIYRYQYSVIVGQNGQIPSFLEIFSKKTLFWK